MRVAFVGSKPLGAEVLRTMGQLMRAPHALVGVVTIDDREDPRTAYDELHASAKDLGLEPVVVRSSAETAAEVERLGADVAIVCGWYLRLPVEDSATRFFGLHASKLPAYRGFSPAVWQLIAGEPEVGLSFFELSPGIDEGDVLGAAAVPVGPEETIADALERLEDASVKLVRAHLPGLLDGTATPTPQDHAGATYCGPRNAADGRIDWSWSAQAVHDFVRAQTRPYPGAFTTLPDGDVVRLWRTRVHPRPYLGVPGGVCERRAGAAVVACGEGAVEVLAASIDGHPDAPPDVVLGSLALRLGRR